MNEAKLKQRRDYLCQLFSGAPIAKSFGMKIHYTEDGHAVFTQPYNKNYNHALGGIHGGVFAVMLDNAGWFTVAPYFDTWTATVEFTTRLLEPVTEEELIAEGEIIRLGKKLTVADMKIHSGSGKLVATGSGTFAVTGAPLFDKMGE